MGRTSEIGGAEDGGQPLKSESILYQRLWEYNLAKLISFDIDGTLEVGEPPGIITMDMVREAQKSGYLIGSCSDRTISEQKRLWEEHGVRVDFTVLKHNLGDVAARFEADEYVHIGDTDLDLRVSQSAGFRFIPVEEAPSLVWGINGKS